MNDDELEMRLMMALQSSIIPAYYCAAQSALMGAVQARADMRRAQIDLENARLVHEQMMRESKS